MHDELFKKPAIVARYRAGPYVEARERFLRLLKVSQPFMPLVARRFS